MSAKREEEETCLEDMDVDGSNVLKRKNEEEGRQEQLEAEIKRVALDDDTDVQSQLEEEGDDENKKKKKQIQLRILCLVREASMVVGRKGEEINKIKQHTNTRINVSENLKDVPERVIYVRGSCDNVAKALGMISRCFGGNSTPQEGESTAVDLPLTVKILIPHHLMGAVIGKNASRFREIEELSSARLSAASQPLLYSTDRILSITGVPDSISIAVLHIAETLCNIEDSIKFKKKPIYYQPNAMYSVLMDPPYNSMGMVYGQPAMADNNINANSALVFAHQQHHQYHPMDKYTNVRATKRLPRNIMSASSINTQSPAMVMYVPAAAATAPAAFHPSAQSQTPNGLHVLYTTSNVANATSFQPNYIIPNVRLTEPAVSNPKKGKRKISDGSEKNVNHHKSSSNSSSSDINIDNTQSNGNQNEVTKNRSLHGKNYQAQHKVPPMTFVQQDIYIDDNFVGNIIGKDGKHINSIKESTGCSIFIENSAQGQSAERKLTIRGTPMGLQAAIMLISNKIETDKLNTGKRKGSI